MRSYKHHYRVTNIISLTSSEKQYLASCHVGEVINQKLLKSIHFCRMMQCVNVAYAVMHFCLSVTFVNSVNTNMSSKVFYHRVATPF